VSAEAISFALDLAPVAADRGGQPPTAGKIVLADRPTTLGGMGAFPASGHAGPLPPLSERTVRTSLDRLQAEGIISTCDSDHGVRTRAGCWRS
jgi:hypothetical protein